MKNFFLQVERVITFPASHIKELRKSLKSNLENILKFLFAGKDVGFDVLKYMIHVYKSPSSLSDKMSNFNLDRILHIEYSIICQKI